MLKNFIKFFEDDTRNDTIALSGLGLGVVSFIGMNVGLNYILSTVLVLIGLSLLITPTLMSVVVDLQKGYEYDKLAELKHAKEVAVSVQVTKQAVPRYKRNPNPYNTLTYSPLEKVESRRRK